MVANSSPVAGSGAAKIPETHTPLISMVGYVALMILSAVPLTLFYGFSYVAYLVGYSSVEKTAEKLIAILFAHPLQYNPFDDTLCATKNIATRSDIWEGKDVKLAEEKTKFWGFKPTTQLEGAQTEGICLGASISIIKEIQETNVTDESHLIRIISKYREGFSTEAAAMQVAYEALGRDITDKMNNLQDVKGFHDTVKTYRRLENSMDNISRVAKVARMVDIRIDYRKNTTKPGCYCICSTDHAVAKLNFNFGSYIVDPNYGLYRFDAKRQEIYKDFNYVYTFQKAA